ncbi:unnamed protein product [Linum tenue]|uniref:DUF4378 domain-containing protein n=1 Tax=Linum tenue TaxID=586396 RepID=A0AAV0QGG3_9ROSI|nr:unnamed protein product [Linum tenue]
MYRPFVTCDDPKGVVECGTIRKSKHVLQKMEEEHNKKMAGHRQQGNKKGSIEAAKLAMGKRRGDKEHYNNNTNNPSSFQLLEVSKGAQKLNKVVDSWSREGNKGYDGEGGSKEKMAKDLLKGALDLKESLVMLGKLQEASKYMAKLKKKQQQKESPDLVRTDAEFPLMRRVSSCREGGGGGGGFGDYQKPRHSYDGASSSGDYIDELRSAITDSFARQNLLSDDERAWLERRRIGVGSMVAQYSKAIVVHPTESSKVAKKERSSNLIARLMGLEEIHPPGSPTRIPQKRVDIEMPKLRKQQQQQQHDALLVKAAAAVHEAHRQQQQQQRSLKELLDTMEFRGLLLKGSSAKKEEDFKAHSQSNHQQLLSDIGSTPPIVLIKPFHVPESEKPFQQPMVYEEGEVVSSNLHARKVRVKEDNGGRSQRIDQEEVKRIVNGKNRMMMERKLRAEEAERRSISPGNGGSKEQKDSVPRVKEGNKSNNGKIRAGRPVKQEEKKEIVDKKVVKIQKVVASNEEAPVAKETVKVRNGVRTQDKGKVPTSRKMRSSEVGGIGSRSQSSQQQNATRDNAKGKKMEKKMVDEVTEVTQESTDLQEHKEDCNELELVGEIRPVEEESSSFNATVEQICRGGEETSSSEIPLEVEHCTESHSPQKIVPLETSDSRENVESAESKARIHFKTFLLSSQEFLTRVEELFPLTTVPSPNTILSTSTTFDPLDEKLSLDYANELIKCKSDPDSQARRDGLLLLTSCAGGALRKHVSLDQLVEEVCNGVETLQGYSNNYRVLGSGRQPRQATDSVNSILEKDVKSIGVVSGVWELGWRNGFSMEEAEHAVIDLETLILDQLIDEVFTT